MRFAKAHAYGNDFLYVERAEAPDVAFDRLAPLVCDRHTGIGADGLIVEVHPTPEKARSDGAQTLNGEQFTHVMAQMRRVAAAVDRSIAALS